MLLQKLKDQSIATKISIVVIPVTIAFVVIASSFSFLQFKQVLLSNVQQNLSQDVRQIVNLVKLEFSNRYAALSALEQNSILKTDLLHQSNTKSHQYLKAMTNADPSILSLEVYDKSGEILASSHSRAMPNAKKESWFIQAEYEGKGFLGPSESKAFNRPVIFFVTQIKTEDGFIGAVKMVLDSKRILGTLNTTQDIAKQQGYNTKHYFILNGGGDLIFSKNSDLSWKILRGFEYEEELQGKADPVVQPASLNGEFLVFQNRAGLFDEIDGLDWIVVASQSRSEAYSEAVQSLQTISWFWVAVISLLAGVIFIGIRFLNRPLIHLIDLIEKVIETRKFSFRIPVGDRDEAGRLSDAFNDLMSNLEENIQKLENQKDLFKSVIENMGDGLLVGDRKGRLLISNKKGRIIANLSNDNIGKPFAPTCFYHHATGKHVEVEDLPIKRVLRGERVENLMLSVVNPLVPEGTVVSVHATALHDKGTGIKAGIVVFRDVTDSMVADQKLEDTRLQLIEKDKMATIGIMAGGIAHEINNPLAIIMGSAELLVEILEDSFDKEQFLAISEDIIVTSQRISKIVKGLRGISRDGQNDPLMPTTVANLIEETLVFCEGKLEEKEIQIRFSHDREELNRLNVLARESQISQVLLNLLKNAMDAVEPLHERWISIEIHSLEEQVKISVVDSGSGIPPEIQKQILTPFFTTKEVGKGTGLGLSISKKILEDHGGDLVIEDRANTCFSIILPKKAAQETKRAV